MCIILCTYCYHLFKQLANGIYNYDYNDYFYSKTAKKKPVAGIQDSYSAVDEEIQGVVIAIRFVGIMLQISFIILFQISLKISSLC